MRCLEDSCELKIRMVLRKYYYGEQLDKEDIEIVGKYIFFSNIRVGLHSFDDYDSLATELLVKAKFGSGNFSIKEKELLGKIWNELRIKCFNDETTCIEKSSTDKFQTIKTIMRILKKRK